LVARRPKAAQSGWLCNGWSEQHHLVNHRPGSGVDTERVELGTGVVARREVMAKGVRPKAGRFN
jgi:hypothetical protein